MNVVKFLVVGLIAVGLSYATAALLNLDSFAAFVVGAIYGLMAASIAISRGWI